MTLKARLTKFLRRFYGPDCADCIHSRAIGDGPRFCHWRGHWRMADNCRSHGGHCGRSGDHFEAQE